ncbi:MAG: DUF1858 domain-containing protein [Deltaproteobacteria bacterium]|nr:DUF1858 domain-containing protein [Deltaproteobacteria bacterium]
MAAGHDEPQGKIKKEMFVRDVVKEYPETLEVFRKHFGVMALRMPGSRVESIEFACAMHDMSHVPVLKELNELVGD